MHYARETRCAFHTTLPCYSPPESPEIKMEIFSNYVSLERPTSKDFNSPLSSPLLASSSSSMSSPSSVDGSTAQTPSPDAGSHVGQVFIPCPLSGPLLSYLQVHTLFPSCHLLVTLLLLTPSMCLPLSCVSSSHVFLLPCLSHVLCLSQGSCPFS